MEYQNLVARTLEAKERAMPYVDLFGDQDTAELRKRGYRKLGYNFEGIYKKIYLSHDHVVKVSKNAEHEYRVYARASSNDKRNLAPTMRLGSGVVIQPRGKVIGRSANNYAAPVYNWKPAYQKFSRQLDIVRDAVTAMGVQDAHNGNLALFGDMILCIDFADYVDIW